MGKRPASTQISNPKADAQTKPPSQLPITPGSHTLSSVASTHATTLSPSPRETVAQVSRTSHGPPVLPQSWAAPFPGSSTQPVATPKIPAQISPAPQSAVSPGVQSTDSRHTSSPTSMISADTQTKPVSQGPPSPQLSAVPALGSGTHPVSPSGPLAQILPGSQSPVSPGVHSTASTQMSKPVSRTSAPTHTKPFSHGPPSAPHSSPGGVS